MRVLLTCALLALFCLPVRAPAQAGLALARANELRQALQEILQSPQPTRSSYQRYFELFPSSVNELQALFVREDYRAILLQGMPADAIDRYYVHACRAYDFVGAQRYVEKFLRIGIDAGNWGGVPNRDNTDLTTIGHLYQYLLFRYPCATAETPGFDDALVAVAARLNDAQLERAYVSLGWDGAEGSGLEWSGAEYLLNGVCRQKPGRCVTTRALTGKYSNAKNINR